jgi:hypothetical protein
VPLNPVTTELTTAATDAVLGVLCVVIVFRLGRTGVSAAWNRGLWRWVFALLGLASLLGAFAHGLDVPEWVRTMVWWPLYLSLGVAVALFVVAGIHDWRGEGAARAALPWGIAIGVGFFGLTQVLGGAFLVFVVYEGLAMVAALAIYVGLRTRARFPGAGTIAAGITLSIVAAVVQASALSARVIVPLDHNGLFHLLQIAATVTLAVGVSAGLRSSAGARR